MRRPESLRHRVFIALVGSILVSTCSAAAGMHIWGSQAVELDRIRAFAVDQFAAVWSESERREALVASLEQHFPVQVSLREAESGRLPDSKVGCSGVVESLPVRRDGLLLGSAEICIHKHRLSNVLLLGLGSFVLLLWISSGYVARRLLRPLDGLVRVVREIGDGKLSARVRLTRTCAGGLRDAGGEVGELSQAVNQMAEKIERQIAGQKELMAAVSHEVRSPLTRLRMLVELERDARGNDAHLDAMDTELSEMDALAGQLLAQSRLEFETFEKASIQSSDLATIALERMGISLALLCDESGGARVCVDAGLIGRALLNLLENAVKHGGGLSALRLWEQDGMVIFGVVDRGPGFSLEAKRRAFEPFAGDGKKRNLGLGLSLVKRIADAHGGSVELGSHPAGGAIVSLRLPKERG